MAIQRVHSFFSLHARGLDPVFLLLYFRSTLPTNLLFVLQTAKYCVQTEAECTLGDEELLESSVFHGEVCV